MNKKLTSQNSKLYGVDGQLINAKPYVRAGIKTGRNDSCSCGSGKKFKKCCGF